MVFKNYGSEVILLNAFESERLRCINKELQAVKGTFQWMWLKWTSETAELWRHKKYVQPFQCKCSSTT